MNAYVDGFSGSHFGPGNNQRPSPEISKIQSSAIMNSKNLSCANSYQTTNLHFTSSKWPVGIPLHSDIRPLFGSKRQRLMDVLIKQFSGNYIEDPDRSV